MHRKVLSPAWVAMVIFSLCGCGSEEQSYSEARGQVFVDGKPAEGALITLVPLNSPDNPDRKPSGTVGPDGSFSLSTFESTAHTTHKGALPGEYTVLVTWYPQPTRESLKRGVAEPDRLCGRYKDLRTSRLRADIKDGPTELPTISLPAIDTKGTRRSSQG